MKTNQGDYIVVRIGPKNALAKVQVALTEKKKFKAVLEVEAQEAETPTPFDFNPDEVVANLGPAPAPGKAYGVKIEVLHRRIPTKFFGEIRIMRDFDDTQFKKLKSTLKSVETEWNRRKLPETRIDTIIKSQDGKYSGSYRTRSAETDLMTLMPHEDMSEMSYVVSHELAHGLWYRNFTPRMHNAWVKMYHKAVVLYEIGNKDLVAMLKEIEESEDLFAYIRGCDEETQPVMKAILRYVKQVHGVDKKHLQTALVLGESIESYWPHSIEIGDKELIISDYARKSPEELFAEAFAFHFAGSKLPKSIARLLEDSLSTLVKDKQ